MGQKKKASKKKSRKKRSNFSFKNCENAEFEVIFKKPHAGHFGEDTDGICQAPDEEMSKIYVSPYLTKQSELNTVIHEMAHAFFWDASEKTITKFANTCSRFLYDQCGWRKTERRRSKQYRGK